MLIEKIIKDGLRELNKNNYSNLRVDNVIVGKSIYTMKKSDVVFSDMNICLLLLENGYGFSYFHEDIDFTLYEKYVNKNINEILKDNIPLHFKVAIADSIYSVLNNLLNQSDNSYLYFKGNLRTKSKLRASEIVKDIPQGSTVLLLGAVTEIIEECNRKKLNITVYDLEPSKKGLKIDSTTIQKPTSLETEDINEKFDYVIATGMTLVSNTLDYLLEKARHKKFKLILYMETGSNIGAKLLEYGAHKVISEFFPFYDFYGETKYRIYER